MIVQAQDVRAGDLVSTRTERRFRVLDVQRRPRAEGFTFDVVLVGRTEHEPDPLEPLADGAAYVGPVRRLEPVPRAHVLELLERELGSTPRAEVRLEAIVEQLEHALVEPDRERLEVNVDALRAVTRAARAYLRLLLALEILERKGNL